MTYVLTDKVISDIVTLAQAKQCLNIDPADTSQDDLINAIIAASITRAERAMNRDILTTTYENYRDSWYTDLTLRRGAFQSVVSVEYLLDSIYTTLDPSEYTSTIGGSFGQICEINPPSSDRVCNDIRITFKTGWGDDVSFVPADIIQAIKTDIVYLYSNRGDCSCSAEGMMSPISAAIYSSYRIVNIATDIISACL